MDVVRHSCFLHDWSAGVGLGMADDHSPYGANAAGGAAHLDDRYTRYYCPG